MSGRKKTGRRQAQENGAREAQQRFGRQEETDPREAADEATAREAADDDAAAAVEDEGNGQVPLEQYQRLLAEFDNYRKRMEIQQQRTAAWAREELMQRLLPLIDDFDRARTALETHPEHLDRKGILIILGRLAETLKREGLSEVEAAPGEEFDPAVHEAVLMVPTAEVPEGTIAEVLETGYRSGERLLRPARVSVARAPEGEPSEQAAGSG